MDDEEYDDDIALATDLFLTAIATLTLASRLVYNQATERECWKIASLLGDTGRKVQNRDPAEYEL